MVDASRAGVVARRVHLLVVHQRPEALQQPADLRMRPRVPRGQSTQVARAGPAGYRSVGRARAQVQRHLLAARDACERTRRPARAGPQRGAQGLGRRRERPEARGQGGLRGARQAAHDAVVALQVLEPRPPGPPPPRPPPPPAGRCARSGRARGPGPRSRVPRGARRQHRIDVEHAGHRPRVSAHAIGRGQDAPAAGGRRDRRRRG